MFGAGKNTSGNEGRRLLAHELAHVMQQSVGTHGGVIRRCDTANCNTSQIALIETAVVTAQRNIRTARTILAVSPLTSDAENALWLYFRDSSVNTTSTVIQNLGTISSQLAGLTYECEDDCPENQEGYVRLGTMLTGLGNIHLCMNNLGADADKIANTIIHEVAHFALLANDSAGYFEDSCNESESTVGAPASIRLSLADSYSCFVQNSATGTATARTEARGDLTGANLAGIQYAPPGPIDLNAPNPRRPMFWMHLTRGPLAHITGVSYRWSLRDPQDNAYLMTNLDGDVLQEFRPASESVLAIINTRTRALLRARGVTSGRVLCRAASPVFGYRLFEIVVAFT